MATNSIPDSDSDGESDRDSLFGGVFDNNVNGSDLELESEDGDVISSDSDEAGDLGEAAQDDNADEEMETDHRDDTVTGPRRWNPATATPVRVAFHQVAGPTTPMPATKNELDFLNLVFPEELYALIATQTNLYASQQIATKPDSVWTDTTPEEIKIFVGLQVHTHTRTLHTCAHILSVYIFNCGGRQ
jgi:hypothetical protein